MIVTHAFRIYLFQFQWYHLQFYLLFTGSVAADSASAPKFQTAEAYGENLTCIGIPVGIL